MLGQVPRETNSEEEACWQETDRAVISGTTLVRERGQQNFTERRRNAMAL